MITHEEYIQEPLTTREGKTARHRNKVQRVTPPRDLVATAITHTINFVSNQLQERLKQIKEVNKQLDALFGPSQEALKNDKEGAAKLATLRKAQLASSQIVNGHKHPSHKNTVPFSLSRTSMSLQAGINVLSPPWESFFFPNPPNIPFEFANGNVFSDTGVLVATRDTYTGEIVGDGGSGTASAGVGVFISSPVDTPVSVRPFMPYDYNWDDDSVAGFTAHTSGGVGAMVYEAGAPTPFIDIRPQLWDDGTSWSHDGDAQSGFLADHLQNNELAFSMVAGQAYLVWFWIWGHADCSGDVFNPIFGSPWGSVSAFRMTANLDFMVVET